MDQIGTLIRTYRRNNKITLKQMAEKTQLSVSFLSEIERGVAKPSMDSLRKIARTLEISLLSFSDPDKQTATRQLHLEHCHDDDSLHFLILFACSAIMVCLFLPTPVMVSFFQWEGRVEGICVTPLPVMSRPPKPNSTACNTPPAPVRK